MSTSPQAAFSRERIAANYPVIRPHIRRTPVVQVDGSDFGLDGVELYFKLELVQHSGSFKARGAFTSLLTRKVPAAGVAAASGGNHGAAVAFAARKLGVHAKIFVPSTAPPVKVARLKAYGAEIVMPGETYPEAQAACQQWVQESGAMQIHPYDQAETLLGQGSVGLEMEEQVPNLDTLLVAVGGGGLIGGIAAWYEGGVKVIAVEPERAPNLDYALKAGRPVDAPGGGLAKDSLGAHLTGELMFPLAQRYLDPVCLVPDDSIREAQLALWDRLRVVSEPGGAAAFAGLISRRYVPKPGERVGVLVCGGNTAAVDFSR